LPFRVRAIPLLSELAKSVHTRTDGVVEPWRGELRRGLERLRDGDFADAEAHFARAHRMAPDRAEVCFALGRERLRRGDLDQAEVLLRQAWMRDPSLVSAAAFLARCLGVERRQFAAAHAVLEEAFARHGRVAPLAVVAAEILLEEGRAPAARELAEEVLAGSPEGAREAARALLARVHNQEGLDRVAAGEPEAALFAFRRASALDEDWSAPACNLGAAFEAIGRLDRARAAYEQALAIDPDSQVARFNLARLLHERGDPRGALAVLEGVAREPESADLIALRAELYVETGDPDHASEILSDAVARAPGDPVAWVDLASGWLAIGDRVRAEDCLRIALELDPEHIGAKLRLADLLVRDGRYIEAAQLASQAEAAGPAEVEAYRTGKRRARMHK
jgi:tetratricopeptide (TPR) repeat protein